MFDMAQVTSDFEGSPGVTERGSPGGKDVGCRQITANVASESFRYASPSSLCRKSRIRCEEVAKTCVGCRIRKVGYRMPKL